MSNCTTGIERAVTGYIQDKPYLSYNGKDFIKIIPEVTRKINPENIYSVAQSIASTLNNAINSNITLGKVFYASNFSNNTVGVTIQPTSQQLSLLNADNESEIQEAQKEWDEEQHQKQLDELDRQYQDEIDRGGYTEDQQGEFFNLKENSKADNVTIEKVKKAIEQMGITMATLPGGSINGKADLLKGVISIAQGKENVALTEEMVHMATAILEQTSPKLVTELISKIDRFKIYKQTFEDYKNVYKLSNGKPDIRKIKKEAVDKLIAEVIINQSEGSTEFPELMKEENRNIITRWWEAILDAIRGVYRKTNIDVFNIAGNKILNNKIGTVNDINSSGEFYQLSKNKKVDDFYDTVVDRDSRLVLNPELNGEKRHYTFDGEKVANSVTEKIKKNSTFSKREGLDAFLDDEKRKWGDEGHKYIERYITTNLIDKDGYALSTPKDEEISTNINKKTKVQIENFCKELVGSYPEGTRFLIERKVVNEKVKGKLASTIDFMAIIPIINSKGEDDVKVDVLDWKFTAINKESNDDIPFYKQNEWKEQMGEYSKMMYNYGLSASQLRKARMIPFIANYNYVLPDKPKSGYVLKSIEIGNIDNVKETKLYLLPVALNSETTGNTSIDDLLASLRTQWEKLFKKIVPEEDRHSKTLQLNELSRAIRHLHLQLNFEPLVNVGRTFLNNSRQVIDGFKNVDYSTLTREEIRAKLQDLAQYKDSAQKYATLDDVYLSHVDRENLSPEDKKTLTTLELLSSRSSNIISEIEQLQREYAVQLGVMEGITSDDTANTILNAEREIDAFSKTFLEGSKLSARIIKLGSNLIMNARNLVNIKYGQKMDDFQKILIPLEKEASSKGKKAFDMIGNISETGLRLIKKIDRKFWDDLTEARLTKNKQFLLDNMHKEEYDKLANEIIEKGVTAINNNVFSSDEEADDKRKTYEIKRLRDRLDINRESFNGWESNQFKYLFNRVMKEEGHYSKEYMEMSKSENALKVWEFFTSLNQRAKQLGYLDREGSSFFPLIEASVFDKLNQTDDVLKQSIDFFKDYYTIKVNEHGAYSKIDPETGKVKKTIPKFFTRTDKNVNQLSRDLGKVGSIWIKSLMDYEASKNLEFTLLTLHAVEKSKGGLIVNNGEVVMENGVPKVTDINKNADYFEAIIDDGLYHITENLNSIGSTTLGHVVGKFTKDEEKKENSEVSIKKGLKNTDKWVRGLAIGLKPLIGIANYFGYNFQTFINAGTMFTFSEFTKNNFKLSSMMSTEDKALLHLLMPLNESLIQEKRRQLSKEQSLKDWLSTWSFSDVMMSTNSFPERKLQFATAMSMNDNHMVVDGKIVNIRQYLSKQDRLSKYNMSQEERKKLESSFSDRVKELKEKNLSKVVQIENDKIIIPGVSDEELAKYRTKIIEYGRTLSGLMNEDNKAGYRRDTIFSSFMMFKGWIPKQISVRTLDIQKNIELDEWEYGRARVFAKTFLTLGLKNISQMRDIINGTPKGLEILNEMLENKRAEHFKKTGQILEITNEEFYDLIRTQLNNQIKELGLLVGLISLVLTAKAFQPPDDATDLEKNHYKWWAKGINKISDEVSFYYNPMSADAMTRGSIIPSLGMLTKVEQLFVSLLKETTGVIVDDDEMTDKAHPVKYFLNLVPVGAQIQNEALPYIDPELAKEMGIKVTTASRAR